MEIDNMLCNEKHKTLEKRVDKIEIDVFRLGKAINGKFNKIFFMFVSTMLSVIASLVVMLIGKL